MNLVCLLFKTIWFTKLSQSVSFTFDLIALKSCKESLNWELCSGGDFKLCLCSPSNEIIGLARVL
jgi:thiamine monophosphate kinase